MPTELGEHGRLAAGDVAMVARQMRDRQTNRKFTWRFFLVVTEQKRWTITGWVMGATSAHLRESEMTLSLHDEKNEVQYLPPEEWPEGVHAFRMALILQRKIEDI